MVGEENKAGEDETMRCQPVPTRSPAAALMSTEKPLPPAQRRAPRWRGTHRVCAAAGGRERRLQSGGRQSGGTAEDEGWSCPGVGARARPRAQLSRGCCRSLPASPEARGAAGARRGWARSSARPAAGIGVCPAVLSVLSLCPCTVPLQGRTRQQGSLPSASACGAGQAAQWFCVTKPGMERKR